MLHGDQMNLIVPQSCLRYIRVQHTNLNLSRTLKDEHAVAGYCERVAREFRMIEPFLPKDVKSIIGIGCGIGGSEVLLSRTYPDASIMLLDGDGFDVHFKGQVRETSNAGWHPEDTAIYNSREQTERFMQANGVTIAGWYDLNTKEKLKADLIFSLHSWGFHYPLHTYDAHGWICTDLRRNQYQALISALPKKQGQLIMRAQKNDRWIWWED